MLVSDVPTSAFTKLFANVSFVSFNYDRTIEQFLRSWLGRVVGASDEEAIRYLDGLEVLRPYGSLGPAFGHRAIPFGTEPRSCDLPSIGSNIRTYTEQVQEQTLLTAIEDRICASEVVVFLGFHFHSQNMRLLTPKKRTQVSQIFATAQGFSKADAESIGEMLASTLRGGKTGGRVGAAPRVFVRNDLTCSGLFKEYQRSLKG